MLRTPAVYRDYPLDVLSSALSALLLTTYLGTEMLSYAQACAERVKEDDKKGTAHCSGQYFDFWKCVDHCVSAKAVIAQTWSADAVFGVCNLLHDC